MPIKNLKGSGLPDSAKLSNYLDNERQAVRLTNLRAGQTMEIDVSLDGAVDGKYVYPEGPAEWKGPTGLEAVHIGLLSFVGCTGAEIHFTAKAETKNSRGRGINFARVRDCQIYDPWVRGARAAGINFEDCHGVKVYRPVTIDTSNYQETRTDVDENNVAGSIKFRRCSGCEVYDAISLDHVGNGVTATESTGGLWVNPTTLEVYGANMYVNASPNHVVRGGIALGTKAHRPNAYVVNSEKENKGIASEGATFEACLAFDVGQGFGVWGNEENVIPLERIAVLNSRFVGDTTEPKLHKRSPIKVFDQTGTKYLASTAIDPTALGAIRNLRNSLADLVRKHADWEEIQQERETIRFAIGTLGGAVVDPDPAIDRELLRGLLTDQQRLLERIMAAVG